MAKQINFIIPDEMAGRSTPSLVDEQAGMDSLISLMTLRTMGASRGSRIMGMGFFQTRLKTKVSSHTSVTGSNWL